MGVVEPGWALTRIAFRVYLDDVKQEGQTSRRQYRMRARAESAKATRERILDAVEAAFDEMPYDEITLATIAERSGVTTQTIIRRFGNRQGLMMTALLQRGSEMRRDREAPVGDVAEAVSILVDHYDEFGDRILWVLAQEDRSQVIGTIAGLGRKYHARWCKRVFAPALDGLHGVEHKRRVAQFATVTDIYVWKILRRDRGLSAQQTKQAMRELLDPLMEHNR
jgi:AcrR family transcriptional regulator